MQMRAALALSMCAAALTKIGARYGVDAVFVGEVTYAEPQTSVKITDINKLEGSARTTIRGDMSAKLLETRTGASEEVLPALLLHLTGDFRPRTARQRAN